MIHMTLVGFADALEPGLLVTALVNFPRQVRFCHVRFSVFDQGPLNISQYPLHGYSQCIDSWVVLAVAGGLCCRPAKGRRYPRKLMFCNQCIVTATVIFRGWLQWCLFVSI